MLVLVRLLLWLLLLLRLLLSGLSLRLLCYLRGVPGGRGSRLNLSWHLRDCGSNTEAGVVLLREVCLLVRHSLRILLALLLGWVHEPLLLLLLLLMMILHLSLLILMLLLNLLLVLIELLVLTDCCLLGSCLPMGLRTAVGSCIIRIGLLHWLLLRVLGVLGVLLVQLLLSLLLLLNLMRMLLLLSLHCQSLLVFDLLQGSHVGHRSLARRAGGGHSLRGSPGLRLQ